VSLPVVAITNQSTVLTDKQVEMVLPALQKQVTDDFRAYWDLDCTLTFLPKDGSLPKGWWQIVIVDNPDEAGALGYHEMSSQGTPLGKVFAKLDIEGGQSWTVTLSHELLEMLADPWINWMAMGEDGQIYALEVADAVEADELGYEIDGVLVSDFVTPGWFEPTENDRVDFKKRIKNRLELAPGGYIGVLGTNGWTQVQAMSRLADMLGMTVASHGSRRQRRTLAKRHWKASTR
jgi:hypothetical protein